MTVHGMNLLTPSDDWSACAATHYRIWDCGTYWNRLHIAPNVIDWAPLDTVVDAALARGATNLTYTIGGTPLWLARDPSLPNFAPWIGPGSNSMVADMAHWQWFVIQLATRYLGKIGSYEIWNEPQLKDFWGYDSWTDLAEMTRIANNAIHSVSPSLKTISGAVLPRASSGGMTRGGKYLSALKAKGWPCDIFGAHFYPEIGYTPGRWRTYAQDWKAKLTELAAPTKPRWVTETNYNLFGGPMTAAGVDDYMTRTSVIADDEGIFKVYWYAWNHSDPNLLGCTFTPTSQGTQTLATLVAG